jgi:hypothetical protein
VKICGRVCKVVVPGLPITCSWQGPSLSTYSFQHRFGGHRGHIFSVLLPLFSPYSIDGRLVSATGQECVKRKAARNGDV